MKCRHKLPAKWNGKCILYSVNFLAFINSFYNNDFYNYESERFLMISTRENWNKNVNLYLAKNVFIKVTHLLRVSAIKR